MIAELDALIAAFETGALTRRGFLQGIVATTTVLPEPAKPRAGSLNHVSLAVADIDASQAFYERVLGVSEVSRQFNGVNLGLGDSFLGLYDIQPRGRIHHYCVGVDDFDIEAQAASLRTLGVEPFIRQDRPELYFSDPDGIRVQLSAADYGG